MNDSANGEVLADIEMDVKSGGVGGSASAAEAGEIGARIVSQR
jgi:hypothetical protein